MRSTDRLSSPGNLTHTVTVAHWGVLVMVAQWDDVPGKLVGCQ
jgi:hypothetical protein